ncbi:MAG: tetratricopeptide repeat protein [Thermoanaerobaculia bacterium]
MSRDRQRWERLEALLDALEDMPEGQRAEHLRRARADDPGLREEALSLLALESEAETYLDDLARDLVRDVLEAPDLRGRRIGAYSLLRPIGRGGMGVVYEAERADGAFEQRVALKLLTAALAGTDARLRFLAERRILAGLQHPAIAGIVDGGVTEDGTPWFAMEHVEGEPVDVYCDRRRLGIRERLELFLKVCDAVEHAHRHLVVHRDLKPAHVLVAEEGRVKLLDFGIAKLLDAEGGAGAASTRTASRLMTPEYASPEQVRGEEVAIASDVYQLGVLLYELLTGHRPYAPQHRSAGELERVIREQPPTRLSAAIGREDTLRPSRDGGEAGEATVEGVCRARRSSPARLRRRLRGDLDNIVLQALRKEPERRYGSVDRLAQDIRRHLDGLPVTARPDTWVYRGRKFLERHAVGAAATALALVLAAGTVTFYTARVRSEAAKAEQVSRFLTGLFESADPRQARGDELTARELLDRGVAQVDRELAEQPEVQAAMLHVLGRTYLEIGLHEPAERLLGRALELRRRRSGRAGREVGETLAEVGLLRYRQGRYRQAARRLDEAIRILEASGRSAAPALGEALAVLGQVHRHLGERERSRAVLERALAVYRRASGEDSEPVARILHDMGALAADMGTLERAEEHYERALAIYERELEADHPRIGYILMDLANVRMELGELEGVDAMYRRSVAIQEKAYGPVHVQVGIALNNFGHFLTAAGRQDEAVDALERAIEVMSATSGPDHPLVAYPLATLGDAHRQAGRLREARSRYRRAVEIREQAVGDQTFDRVLVHAVTWLAQIEADTENADTAEPIVQQALSAWRRAPSTLDPQLTSALLDFARWLAGRQRCADAVPLLQRALQMQTTRSETPAARAADIESLLAICS